MTNYIFLKINKTVPPYQAGDIAKVRCDEEGTPLDHYWRNRLSDAKFDQCVTVVNESGVEPYESKSKSKKSEE